MLLLRLYFDLLMLHRLLAGNLLLQITIQVISFKRR
jgi:hypothetical protein